MNNYQRLISKINQIGHEEVDILMNCRIKHGELFTEYAQQLTKDDMKLYAAESHLEQQRNSKERVKRVK